MIQTRLLTNSEIFTENFERCCNEYHSIDLAVAWCGDPKRQWPYKLLEPFGSEMRATIGVSFAQTHPDGIQWLMNIGADLRIFRDAKNLFHPKIYLFKRGKAFALFVGSSNLTYSGFYQNVEANVLIEGQSNSKTVELMDAIELLDSWRTDTCSFIPDEKWLGDYKAIFESAVNKATKNAIKIPQSNDAGIPEASWLSHADWATFHTQIHESIAGKNRTVNDYLELLQLVSDQLPLPWQNNIFDQLINRKIIGGMNPYGWLGHVAANGRFRGLMANEDDTQTHGTIVQAINKIGRMPLPIDWRKLEAQLTRLTALGPTMKVWGRLLCLVRPDVFCTIASQPVRLNLSQVLGMPPESLATPDGYIALIRLIHATPWFNSSRPANPAQAGIWDNRVAMIDALFYD